MTLTSIIPSKMTQKEIKHVCIELYIAKKWGSNSVIFRLSNGLKYKIYVAKWAYYNENFNGNN